MLNIYIRVDSSLQIGTGHVMRCLTLAEYLRKLGSKITFICRELQGNITGLIEDKDFTVEKLPYPKSFSETTLKNAEPVRHASWLEVDWKKDAEDTQQVFKTCEKEIDWLIVDHYGLDHKWEEHIRSYVKKIMVIDDLADRRHNCDLILDQNLYKNFRERYNNLIFNPCKKLLGPKFSLLRSEFRNERKKLKRNNIEVSRILIFFGGVDYSNETSKALSAIKQINSLNEKSLIIDVVVGKANPHKEHIRNLCATINNCNYYYQVENMGELMRISDLAIGAGGSTTWERCCLGLPALTIALAYNQIAIAETCDLQGLDRYLGLASEVTVERIYEEIRYIVDHPQDIEWSSKLGMQLVDGMGVERVAQFLHNKD